MTQPTYDAVSLAIMWDRLISVTDEIVSTLVRTSFSTIVRESYDLSVVLLDAEGKLMAQGSFSVPVLALPMGFISTREVHQKSRSSSTQTDYIKRR